MGKGSAGRYALYKVVARHWASVAGTEEDEDPDAPRSEHLWTGGAPRREALAREEANEEKGTASSSAGAQYSLASPPPRGSLLSTPLP